MKKALIIDDELLARDIIKEYISELEKLEIIAEFSDGFTGLKGIQEFKPDLVFLDIQMPKLNGFEMLELLDDKPEIIFTTAYDQYAIKAFELNAVDYLLKPFSFERFKESVEKALMRIDSGKSITGRIGSLQADLELKDEILNRIVVKSRNSVVVLPVHQINFMEAQDDFVMIYTENEHYLKQKTLKYYENHLNPEEFLRVHRSYIVKIDLIRKIEPYEKSSRVVVMKNGKKIPISRSGLIRLKSKFDY